MNYIRVIEKMGNFQEDYIMLQTEGYQTLKVEQKGKVGVIRLNRPDKRNAFIPEMYRDLDVVLECMEDEPEIKAIMITGEGKAFCAGGDIQLMQENLRKGLGNVENKRYLKRLHQSWLSKIVNTDKPVVCAVNGYAAGAGFSLALLGDIVIASTKAKFVASFIRVGLTADMAGLYFLPRIIGLNRAKEIIFTGREVPAEEAYTLGIVAKVVEPENLEEAALSMANQLANSALVPIGLQKQILNKIFETDLPTLLEKEQMCFAHCKDTKDFANAVNAFMNKQQPEFSGI